MMRNARLSVARNRSGSSRPAPQSDVYALGIVVFEMLTASIRSPRRR